MVLSRYAGERYAAAESDLWDGVYDVARELIPTRNAAFMLNVSEATLRKWAVAAGMRRTDDEADKRTRNWTRGELQHLATLHHRVLGRPPAEPEPSRRMRELETKVGRLEARLAELEARAVGILPRVGAAGTSQERQEPAEDGGHEQLEALRQKRILARQRDVPRLPDGWVAYSSWCELHDLNKRTADRYVSSGRLEQPQRGLYVNPATGQRVERVYDPQQQALAAEQLATIRRQEPNPPAGGADESETTGDGRAF